MPPILRPFLKLEWKIFIGVGLVLGVAMASSVITYHSISVLLEADEWVRHTEVVLGQIQGTASDFSHMQSLSRGYIATGNTLFLSDFEPFVARGNERLRTLRSLVSDNPAQVRNLNELDAIAQENVSRARHTAELRRAGNAAAAIEQLNSGEGIRLMTALDGIIAKMEAEEGRLLAIRKVASERTSRLAARSGQVGYGLAVLLLVVVATVVSFDLQARHRAEERLRAQHSFTEAVLASLTDGIVACDATGQITLLNQPAKELHETTSDRMTPDEWVKLCERTRLDGTHLMPDDFPLARALRGEEVDDFEIRVVPRSGQARVILVTARAIGKSDGERIGAVASFDDVTETRAATARRLEAELLYQTVISNMAEGVCVQDAPEGVIRAYNESALRILHLTAEQFEGSSSTGLDYMTIHPDGSPFPGEEHPAMVTLRTGQPQSNVTMGLRTADGGTNWILINSRRGSLGIGDLCRTFVVTTFTDVTELRQANEELRRAEETLRASERRLNLALDAAHLGFWELDVASDTTIRNLRHDQIMGYSTLQPEFGIRAFLCQVIPEQREMVRRRLDEAYATGAFSLECQIVWPDQSVHWVSARGSALRDSESSPLRMMGIVSEISERKAAEAALKASEARYRGVVEDQAEFICRFLPDGTITFMNQSFIRYFGVTEEWIGRRWSPVTFPKDLARVESELNAVSPEHPRITIENRVYDGRKRLRWGQFVNRGIFDSAGRIQEYQSVGRDITDQKVAEAALRESEAAFHTLADAMPQIVWMCTADGLNIYSNQRWTDYTGLTSEASHGVAWSTPFHLEDKQAAQEAWQRAIETGESYRINARLRSSAGGYRWFLMRGVPLRDEAGTIIKWLGTCTDINDMVQAEAELRLLNELLGQANSYNRSLIEASLDPLVMIGPGGRITDANAATEKATGCDRMELSGSDFSEYFTEHDKARAAYEEAFRAGFVRDCSLELRHRNGTVTPVVYNASVYRDETGKTIGVFAAARDITAQKRVESELALHREQLEKTVTALRNSVADKEVLLREIHHRVKNNLQVVSSLLHMQWRRTSDPGARELLRESENRLHSMGAIHESLYRSSDLSRVDLPKYLGRIVDQVADSYRRPGVTCILESKNEVIATTEVAMPCGLIVNELLSNALKHAFQDRPGQVKVTLRRAGSMVTLTVEDNGSGLPENFAIEQTRGLGMQLVRTLTSQLDGVLRVARGNGNQGNGTNFEIEFAAE